MARTAQCESALCEDPMYLNCCISYMNFSLIKPQITFNASLDNVPFQTLMTDYSSTIGPGIQLGKENGLTLLLGKKYV